jgi:hypothetical protein
MSDALKSLSRKDSDNCCPNSGISSCEEFAMRADSLTPLTENQFSVIRFVYFGLALDLEFLTILTFSVPPSAGKSSPQAKNPSQKQSDSASPITIFIQTGETGSFTTSNALKSSTLCTSPGSSQHSSLQNSPIQLHALLLNPNSKKKTQKALVAVVLLALAGSLVLLVLIITVAWLIIRKFGGS